jgi:hypothetical protein
MTDIALLTTFYLVIGWFVITILVLLGYILTSVYGLYLYNRLTRCYHLKVVGRVLLQLERSGVSGLKDGTWTNDRGI